MSSERTVRIVRPDSSYVGKQGLTYALGITGQTTGARGICLTVATMPPGARAKAHYHDRIDTVGYDIAGEASLLFGDQLEQSVIGREGEYFFIPAGMPHAPSTTVMRPAPSWSRTRQVMTRKGSSCGRTSMSSPCRTARLHQTNQGHSGVRATRVTSQRNTMTVERIVNLDIDDGTSTTT